MSGSQRPSSAARVRMERRDMVTRAAQEGLSNLVILAIDERAEDAEVLAEARGPRDVPLVTACLHGHLDVVRNLIDKCHASVNCQAEVTVEESDIKDVTPLWAATYFGSEPTVRYLLQNGANTNQKTANGSIPLHVAAYRGHVTILTSLLEHGSDVNCVNAKGFSVLMNACTKNDSGFTSMVEMLLKRGASVNHVQTSTGNTALHEAAGSGAVDIGQLLLDNGASICRNKDGNSPLTKAALERKDDFVELMLHCSDFSRDDKADGLELLGTSHWLEQDTDRCVSLWERAMRDRHQPGKPVAEKREADHSVAVYGHAVEAQTLQAVQKLRESGSSEALGVQSMLVRERVLGKEHPDTTFIIKYAAAVQADNQNFTMTIQLLVHVLDNIADIFPFEDHTLGVYQLLVGITAESEKTGCTVPFGQLVKALRYGLRDFQRGEEALRRKDNNDACLEVRGNLLKILLHIVCLCQQARPRASAADDSQFGRAVTDFVKTGVEGKGGNSLLHLACQSDTSQLDTSDEPYEGCQFPAVAAVQALLKAGSPATARNQAGKTALQVLREQEGDHPAIVQLLMQAGCV